MDADEAAHARLSALLEDRISIVPESLADVVVIDIGPDRTIGDTLADGFTAATVVLLDDPRLDVALALLRAGASAVLARQSDEREILAAIEAAAAGLIALDATAREGLSTLVRSASSNAAALTGREREVLDMLAEGLSNKRIALRLNLSEHTVKFHVGSILAKLGAATRAEAVRLGVRQGYVML